ncbi:MAG: peptidoglycan DD-metalloendopeptidase family protein [Elusimicrobia bacterium]|nr:peptidoglycan DD-metalloendopeptidase family protein [Elusimicrobiota bacterium]
MRVALLLFFILCAPSFAQDKKQELKQIQSQLDARKKELEQWKKQESDIERHISFLEERRSQAKKMQTRLSSEVSSAERKISDYERKQKTVESVSRRWEEMVSANVRLYAERKIISFPFYGSGDLAAQAFLESSIHRDCAFLKKLKGESDVALKTAVLWKNKTASLLARSKELKEEDKVRQKHYQEKTASLEQTRQKYQQTLREVEELKNSAQSLMRLLEKFEKSAALKRKMYGKKEMPIPRHSLLWPADGKVVGKFGREDIASLGTWVFREGIKISAQPGTAVKSSAGGQVIYAGAFRSYGNVVILDNGGFFTVYGYLGAITVQKGDEVLPGAQLALAGGEESAVYFEVRQGANALNPVDWLAMK